MKFKIFAIAICSFILFEQCTITCPTKCDDNMTFGFVNFDSTNLDSVIITAYVADGKFDIQVGSPATFNLLYGYRIGKSDTVYLYYLNKTSELDTIYDLKLSLLPSNKTYTVTDIKMVGDLESDIKIPAERECVSERPSCQRAISSCKVNGTTLYNIPKNYVGGDNVIYLSR